MGSQRTFAAAAAVLSMLACRAAVAQSSFELQLFRPSPHGASLISVESGAIAPSPEVRFGLLFDYAFKPLQTVRAANQRQAGIVDHRLDVDFYVAASLFDRLSIALAIPVTVFQLGSLASLTAASGLARAAFGDVRGDVKVGLLDQRRFWIDWAARVAVTAPSGYESGFAGDRTITFSPELDFSRNFSGVTLALNFGYTWRKPSQLGDLVVGQELFYRGGLAVDLAAFARKVPVTLIGELFGRTAALEPFRNEAQNPLQWIAGVRVDVARRAFITVGGGKGILPGYGVPAARAFISFAFVPLLGKSAAARAIADAPPDGDLDQDGVKNAADKCPRAPEDQDAFEDQDGCPDPDNDRDGNPDPSDKCPNQPEDRLGDANDGCPGADQDRDGIPDSLDQCPAAAEDKDGFLDQDGCPDLDNDRDGIADTLDKCPKQAETINGVADQDGCPDAAFVELVGKDIVLGRPILFEPDSSLMSQTAADVLDHLAGLLRTHPELARVRIEVYDNETMGDPSYAARLSQGRASVVVDYLVSRGIARARLEAVGHGKRFSGSERRGATVILTVLK